MGKAALGKLRTVHITANTKQRKKNEESQSEYVRKNPMVWSLK